MLPDPAPTDDSQNFEADLERAANGDLAARNRLWGDHYETLHHCAKVWLAKAWQPRGDDHHISLGATHIVNAAWERLHDRTAALVNGKPWFFRCFYTECMRIVVDHYRKTRNDKGRGEAKRVDYQSGYLADNGLHPDFDKLYEVLGELGDENPLVGQIAMIKVFETRPSEDGKRTQRGLTNKEIAEMLGIGLRTVEEHWSFAKAKMWMRLSEGKSG